MASLSDIVNSGTANDRSLIANTLIAKGAKLKTLLSATETVNIHGTPFEVGASSGYLVPSGNVFVVVAVDISQDAGAAGANMGMCSATSDVGSNSAAAPTGRDLTVSLTQLGFSEAADTRYFRTLFMRIPAGRYLYVNCAFAGGSGSYVIYGYEIAADAIDF
jgi:hypothetical protein